MTIWSPDISQAAGHRYIAIADAIDRDVATGVLVEGARLPTHRDLARALGITVGTVTRAYAEAERRGLTEGIVGRGTFIRSRHAPEDLGWREAVASEGEDVIDMSLACPWVAPDGEEGQLLADTLRDIASGRSLDELLVYHSKSAHPRHRAVAAAWLGRIGMEISPDQLVVTNGAQHAIAVALATLLRPGDRLITAELTYPGLKAIARTLGLSVRGVGMDHEGIRPDELDRACAEAPTQALYCVPSIQNPTGATMSSERRQEIAAVATKHGLIIVEDQIHIRLDGEGLPPLATFAPERTVHITTLCKWATFGLRVGFVAAPERAVERIRSGVRSTLWMPAPLMVEVATRWMKDGTGERLAGLKRRELLARHRMVEEILGDRYRIDTDPHALHVWLHLPEPLRSDECVAQARQRGVLIAGAEAFAVGRSVPHAVRVSIAAVPDRAELRRGLEVLSDVLQSRSEPCVTIL